MIFAASRPTSRARQIFTRATMWSYLKIIVERARIRPKHIGIIIYTSVADLRDIERQLTNTSRPIKFVFILYF